MYWYINIQATESGRGRGTGRVAGGRARASSSTQPPRASSQATTNNESGRGRGTWRVSSSIGVPTQSHGTATNTEVIYLIIISFLDNIDML